MVASPPSPSASRPYQSCRAVHGRGSEGPVRVDWSFSRLPSRICCAAFADLKKTMAPILLHPNSTLPFTILTDASDTARSFFRTPGGAPASTSGTASPGLGHLRQRDGDIFGRRQAMAPLARRTVKCDIITVSHLMRQAKLTGHQAPWVEACGWYQPDAFIIICARITVLACRWGASWHAEYPKSEYSRL